MDYNSVSDKFHFIVVTQGSREAKKYFGLIDSELESTKRTLVSKDFLTETVAKVKEVTRSGDIPVLLIDKYFPGRILDIDLVREVGTECPQGGIIVPIGPNPQQQQIDIIMGKEPNSWWLPHVWGMDVENPEIELNDFKDYLSLYNRWKQKQEVNSENKLS